MYLAHYRFALHPERATPRVLYLAHYRFALHPEPTPPCVGTRGAVVRTWGPCACPRPGGSPTHRQSWEPGLFTIPTGQGPTFVARSHNYRTTDNQTARPPVTSNTMPET